MSPLDARWPWTCAVNCALYRRPDAYQASEADQ